MATQEQQEVTVVVHQKPDVHDDERQKDLIDLIDVVVESAEGRKHDAVPSDQSEGAEQESAEVLEAKINAMSKRLTPKEKRARPSHRR